MTEGMRCERRQTAGRRGVRCSASLTTKFLALSAHVQAVSPQWSLSVKRIWLLSRRTSSASRLFLEAATCIAVRPS